jgi:hypothetical protein
MFANVEASGNLAERFNACFEVLKIIIFKKICGQQGHCRQPTRVTPRKGSTRVGCVSAIVLDHFLYIHNIELAFNQLFVVKLCIFLVEKLDLYE